MSRAATTKAPAVRQAGRSTPLAPVATAATARASRPYEFWRRGGARATLTLVGDLMRVEYSGPMKLTWWAEAAEIADGLAGNAAAALVERFDRALLTLPETGLGGRDSPYRNCLTRRSLPAAMVVPETHQEVFKRYAWHLALIGVERAIFTSEAKALACAQEMVPKRLRRREQVFGADCNEELQ